MKLALRLLIYGSALAAVLWLNADDPSANEVIEWIAFMAVLFVVESVLELASGQPRRPHP